MKITKSKTNKQKKKWCSTDREPNIMQTSTQPDKYAFHDKQGQTKQNKKRTSPN